MYAARAPKLEPNCVPFGLRNRIQGVKLLLSVTSPIPSEMASPAAASKVQVSISPAVEIAPLALSPFARLPWAIAAPWKNAKPVIANNTVTTREEVADTPRRAHQMLITCR